MTQLPHHLFMLNKKGQTPLDIAIQETILASDAKVALGNRADAGDNAAIAEAE